MVVVGHIIITATTCGGRGTLWVVALNSGAPRRPRTHGTKNASLLLALAVAEGVTLGPGPRGDRGLAQAASGRRWPPPACVLLWVPPSGTGRYYNRWLSSITSTMDDECGSMRRKARGLLFTDAPRWGWQNNTGGCPDDCGGGGGGRERETRRGSVGPIGPPSSRGSALPTHTHTLLLCGR